MVISGKQNRPQKVFCYGIEGVGKSLLASHAPVPIFIDTEDRTAHLDINRIVCQDYRAIEGALDYIENGSHFYQTLVLDTIDWVEKLAVGALCQEYNKKGIEDWGYGDGYTYLFERMEMIQRRLDAIQARHGMHLWINGHAHVTKFDDPIAGASYHRYTTKCRDKGKTNVSAMFREWADTVLFAHYETVVEEDKSKVTRAQGGANRVLGTEHTAGYDAKNSWGLPSIIPMDWTYLAPHFAARATQPTTSPAGEAPQQSPSTASTQPAGDELEERKTLQSRAIALAEPMGGKPYVIAALKDRGTNFKSMTIDECRDFVEVIREEATKHFNQKEAAK